MDQNFKFPDQFSMEEAHRLAESSAGQQLFALLQQQGGNELQQAMDCASKGNFSQAQQALARILADPQAQNLLKELGR